MRDILLVLDLDETLVHSVAQPLNRVPDFIVGPHCVYKRSQVDYFLDKVAGWFQLAVWTSAGDGYARQVVAKLMGNRATELAFLWTAERCTQCFDGETHEQYLVKDLKKLKRKGYDLSRVIVLDDTPSMHERNYGNLVRVPEYTGATDDNELVRVLGFLDWLREQPDVRAVEKRWWHDQRQGGDYTEGGSAPRECYS